MLCELQENSYDKYRVLFAAVCCGDCVITMHILLYTVAILCNARSSGNKIKKIFSIERDNGHATVR